MNRGAESGPEVSWAAGDVAEFLAVGKGGNFLDFSAGAGKTREDGSDVGTRLHRDNTELVLFVNPHKEGLFDIVVNSTTLGPVAVQAASLKEAISLLEQEVIVDELLLYLSVQSTESVVSTLEVSFERAKGLSDLLFDLLALLAGETGAEGELCEVTTNADAGGPDHLGILLGERRAHKLLVVHVAYVAIRDHYLVVLGDDGVE